MTVTRRSTVVSLLALGALLSPFPVRAQLATSVGAGASATIYDDAPVVSALVLAPGLDWRDARSRLDAAASLASAADGRVLTGGSLASALTLPAFGRARTELRAVGGWDAFDPTGTRAWWRGEARAHLDGRGRGAWLGLGAGRAIGDGAWHGVASVSAGVWTRIGGATVESSLGAARGGGAARYARAVHTVRFAVQGPDSVYYIDSTFTDSTRVTGARTDADARALVRWVRGALELQLTGGARFSRETGAQLTTQPWGDVQAALWLSPRLALLAAGGRQPALLLEGRTAARYATLALRLAHRVEGDAPAPARVRHPARGAVIVTDAGGGMRTLRFFVPGARTVEMMADFTDWGVRALERDGAGEWTITLPVAPGVHHVDIRIDGGTWIAPAGLASTTDDFGGQSGLLLVQ